jgi:dCMP deaminase
MNCIFYKFAKMATRPNWDTYFMNIADIVKTRSPDRTKVGAVLVSMKDHRIISTGYNGLPQNMDDNAVDWGNRNHVYEIIIHAETNALLYSQSKFEDAVMYCTMSPCKDCIKLLSAARIKKVVYRERYRDFETAQKLCEYFNIDLTQV